MKTGNLIIVLFFSLQGVYAQIEGNSSIMGIGKEKETSLTGYEISTGMSKANNKFTLPGNTENPRDLEENKKSFDMTGDDGFYKPKHELTPKSFKKLEDEESREAYKSDQYLGDFKNEGEFVQIVYRDHGAVDGDLVRIYSNDDVIRSSVFLNATFQGLTIDLIKGFNKIDIEALNQGTSGPNTAEFQVFDEQGKLITSNIWNLTTGVKATLIIVKE